MGKRLEAGEVSTSWSAPMLTWRCSVCKKTEGQDTGQYTDGICVGCLWTHYTEQAVPVLASIVKDGKPLH